MEIALGLIGGIAIVAGIAVAAVVLVVAAQFLLHRFGQTRPHVHERRPHRPGRVGRISKQQGP
jgi:hypothetical protein